jgi:hypothetical protein
VSGIGEESEVELFICSSVSPLVGSFLGGLAWILKIGLYIRSPCYDSLASPTWLILGNLSEMTMSSVITPDDCETTVTVQVSYHTTVQYAEKQSATTIGAGPGHVPSPDLG